MDDPDTAVDAGAAEPLAIWLRNRSAVSFTAEHPEIKIIATVRVNTTNLFFMRLSLYDFEKFLVPISNFIMEAHAE